MPEEQGTLRRVAWSEIFPWLHLVPSVRLALRFRMLLPATIAALLTIAGWWLLSTKIYGESEDPFISSVRDAYRTCPWRPVARYDNFDSATAVLPVGDVTEPPIMGVFSGHPLRAAWRNLSGPVRQIFAGNVTFVSLSFLLLCTLWTSAVWSYFGGIITRMAAMQLGREENIGWGPAARYVRPRLVGYFGAPLLPLLGVLLITLGIALIGLLLRWHGLGVFLAGLLWPLLLVGGLLMAIFLLGLLFGWPLMFPALSSEGGDSFDALSRAYSYVYQRPWHYLFYAIVASILGMFAALLVLGFSEAVIYLTSWAAEWGASQKHSVGETLAASEAADAGRLLIWGGNLIWFFNGCVRAVAIGFMYSYFWSASTSMYLLLRYHVDGAELDEIDVPDSEAAYNLPPLKTDAAGVPMPADMPPGEQPQGDNPPSS